MAGTNVVRELLIQLRVTGTKGAREAFNGVADGLDNVADKAGLAFKAIGLLATASVAVNTALFGAAKSAADYGESILRMSEGLGVSLRETQRLRGAFQLLDADVGDLNDALGTLADRAVDAMEGNKTYAKEFKRIGIQVQDLKNKNPAQLFELVANAAGKVEDKIQSTTFAVRIFGDDLGRKLLPAIVGGSVNLADLANRLEETGAFMDEAGTRQTAKAALEFRLLRFSLQGLIRTLGTKMAPLLEFYSRKMSDAITANRKFIEAGLDKFVKGLFQDLEKLRLIVGSVNDAIERMGGYEATIARITLAFKALVAVLATGGIVSALGSLATALGPLTGVAGSLTAFVGMFSVAPVAMALETLAAIMATAAAPITLIVGAVASLLFVLDDLYVAVKGGNSVLASLAEEGGIVGVAFSVVLGMAQTLYGFISTRFVSIWEKLGNIFKNLMPVLRLLGALFMFFVTGALNGLMTGLAALLTVLDLLLSAFEALSVVVGGFFGLLERAATNAGKPFTKFFGMVNRAIDQVVSKWNSFTEAIDGWAPDFGGILRDGGNLIDGFAGQLGFTRQTGVPTAQFSMAQANSVPTAVGSSSTTTNNVTNANTITVNGAASPEVTAGAVGDELDKRSARASFAGGMR